MLRIPLCGLLLPALAALAGCGESPKPADDRHASPESVAEAYRQAAAEKDWETLFDCLTFDSQNVLFGKTYEWTRQEAARLKRPVSSWEAVVKKHGITEATQVGQLSAERKAALYGDLMQWYHRNFPRAADQSAEMAGLRYVDFQRDGDRASANIRIEGVDRPGREFFRRIDGKWYVDLPARDAFRKQQREKEFARRAKRTAPKTRLKFPNR